MVELAVYKRSIVGVGELEEIDVIWTNVRIRRRGTFKIDRSNFHHRRAQCYRNGERIT
jgi:hypothetical protein